MMASDYRRRAAAPQRPRARVAPGRAAADMARLDEQLVQVQRTRRIAGRERNDAGNLPVDSGRDPPFPLIAQDR
jgi:hypothetical protein